MDGVGAISLFLIEESGLKRFISAIVSFDFGISLFLIEESGLKLLRKFALSLFEEFLSS